MSAFESLPFLTKDDRGGNHNQRMGNLRNCTNKQSKSAKTKKTQKKSV